MFWNCQGIRPERKELELYLKENIIDVIALMKHSLAKTTISKFEVMILSETIIQQAREEMLPSL